MSTRLSLAQQIAQLEDTAPVDFDPEDIHAAGGPDEERDEPNVDNAAAAREHYVDVGPSDIRKLRDSIADPKYDGVRTSRRQLVEESEEEEGINSDEDVEEEEPPSEREEGGVHSNEGREEEEESDEEIFAVRRTSHTENEPVDDLSEEEEGIRSDEEDAEEEGVFPNEGQEEEEESPSQSEVEENFAVRRTENEPVDDLSSTLRKKREEDRKKGKAVSRQLTMWDSILDARIRLQKTVTATNRLPLPTDLPRYTSDAAARASLEKMLEEALSLSEDLQEFQEILLTSNDTLKPPPRKRRRTGGDPDENSRNYENEVREATAAATVLEHAYHPHLLQTLTKWSSKIQAVAPSVLLPSARNAFSSRAHQHQVKNAVQLVEEALADQERLRGKTRVARGKGRIGEESGDKEDVQVFDDTDFYQQLLRDVISTRAADSSLLPPPSSYSNLKSAKSKSAKKKAVDTKASKGRKLRYEVHEKLQNFMVPVPVQAGRGAWHEEQIDELFSSLLGRGFEGGQDVMMDETGDNDRRKLEEEAKKAVDEGFRVFG